jgi:hypothetical protein
MRKIISIIALVALTIYMGSCSYKFNEPEVGPVINPNDTISFANQIAPIFNTNNNCISCHGIGGTSPDLTTANAFNELTSKGLINTSDAAQSKIYYYLEPNSASHSQKKYTTSEAQLVLLWITQGAKNN